MVESRTYGATTLQLELENVRQFELEVDVLIDALDEAVNEIEPKFVCAGLGIDSSTLSNWLSKARNADTGKLLRPPPACLLFFCVRHQRSKRLAAHFALATGFMPPERRSPNSMEDENKLLKQTLRLFGPDGERRAREIEDGFVRLPVAEKGGAR